MERTGHVIPLRTSPVGIWIYGGARCDVKCRALGSAGGSLHCISNVTRDSRSCWDESALPNKLWGAIGFYGYRLGYRPPQFREESHAYQDLLAWSVRAGLLACWFVFGNLSISSRLIMSPSRALPRFSLWAGFIRPSGRFRNKTGKVNYNWPPPCLNVINWHIEVHDSEICCSFWFYRSATCS